MSLYVLCISAGLNQAVKTGSNVTVLLAALGAHASPITVGALMALSGLLPTIFAVSIGRLNDRFGARLPMFAGSVLVIASSLLPVIWPGLPALFVTATLTGLGGTAFSVSTQSTVGHLGQREDRTRNFTWLSMAFSAGGIVGPVVSGWMIDRAGYSGAFFLLAVVPLIALAAVGSGSLELPRPRAASAAVARKSRFVALDLLRDRRLRTVYLLTALHVSAWEVSAFLLPVYGAGIGLAATSIGFILGVFATATFCVRIVLPFFARRFASLALIRASLVLAGCVFIAFPLVSSVAGLAGLAIILGLGLGITQPLAMAVLHEAAPPDRTGEAVGMRTAVVNLSATAMPLLYGALGTALGMTPVFWGIAVAVWMGVWALR